MLSIANLYFSLEGCDHRNGCRQTTSRWVHLPQKHPNTLLSRHSKCSVLEHFGPRSRFLKEFCFGARARAKHLKIVLKPSRSFTTAHDAFGWDNGKIVTFHVHFKISDLFTISRSGLYIYTDTHTHHTVIGNLSTVKSERKRKTIITTIELIKECIAKY